MYFFSVYITYLTSRFTEALTQLHWVKYLNKKCQFIWLHHYKKWKNLNVLQNHCTHFPLKFPNFGILTSKSNLLVLTFELSSAAHYAFVSVDQFC